MGNLYNLLHGMNPDAPIHECCSETFRDSSIPVLERALTYYLYWKLFPKRFAGRFHP